MPAPGTGGHCMIWIASISLALLGAAAVLFLLEDRQGT
jgi:hypothetical protein